MTFLHRVIPTNTQLFKAKIKDNERCSICMNESESLDQINTMLFRI